MNRPKLIAMDVDGTITGAEHVLSEHTKQALRRLSPAGIAAVVVTGRTEWSAVSIARSAGFHAPVISCNGALVTDPDTGERIWEQHVDPEHAASAIAAARACGAVTTVWTADAWYADQEGPTNDLLRLMLEREPVVRPLEEVIATEPVMKIMIGGDRELLDRAGPALEASAPGMMRSMDVFYETGPAHATKREAMAFLLKTLAIDPESTWGFGDSDNDTGWLSLMGRAIAPANAFAGVMAIADVVIGHHSEDSVADYLTAELFS
jgi:Cof subfamily protein (haloacid dehalogenase superfamily)